MVCEKHVNICLRMNTKKTMLLNVPCREEIWKHHCSFESLALLTLGLPNPYREHLKSIEACEND